MLVTGGSRGLGAATVRRFAAAGADVLARTPPADGELPATFLPADLGTAEGTADLARRVIDSAGGVDILVNNAGGGSEPAETLSRTDEAWEADLHLNLLSAGKPGTPEDAAELIVFLASGRAKWLTGAQYRVDGGIIPVTDPL